MKRFIKINDHLFRGSAPTVLEVKELNSKFDIKKIVSLDEESGQKISRICKLLNIVHIIIPIDMIHIEPIVKLLNYNLHDLLIKGGPTFVHCKEGKDRTGMVIAMFKCQYMGWSCHKAIHEAKSLGFGVGLKPNVIKFYEKVICNSCKEKHDHAHIKHIDNNSADIVQDSREQAEDHSESTGMSSFAPMEESRKFPQNQVYDYSYDQYPTRNNVDLKPEQKLNEQSTGTEMPLVGLYDNNSGVKGVGPIENGGGFVNSCIYFDRKKKIALQAEELLK